MDKPQAKILVVDDDEKNVKLLEAQLVPRGYEVVTATNGVEALQQVEAEQPDLMLLDVMMPLMNGFEVCARLKNNPDTCLLPIVIMTALGQVEDRIKGIEAGADDFLTKPVHRDELMARIHTSLRLKQTIDAKLALLQGMKDYLAKFVPQSIQRILEAHPEAPELARKEQDVSVLFVDISGYSRLSEILPQEIEGIVEQYFSHYLDCIHANGGDVTGTAGDGMMVIFLDAEPHQHARKATQAALEMMHRTAQLNARLRSAVEAISIHIGIHSGTAFVGPTKLEGATGTRWTYTANGTVTNVASRISGIAKGGTILLSAETAQRVAGHFTMQPFGRQPLKNIAEEVMLYRVLEQMERRMSHS
jgi:adenylate cyclase